MIEPGKFDITIYQGATFKLDLQFKDGNDNPVNMTGYTVTSKLYNRTGTTALATFANTFVSQTNGQFRLSLTSAATSLLTEGGQYDVLVEEPGGDKFFLLEGFATLDFGFSSK